MKLLHAWGAYMNEYLLLSFFFKKEKVKGVEIVSW